MRKSLVVAGSAAMLLLGFGGVAAQAAPAQGTGGELPPPGAALAIPASGTPHLKASLDNPIQQVRQLVQCGNTMYAVGSFTTIVRGSTSYARTDVFSFQASAPFTVTSWAPKIVGSTGNTSKGSAGINTIAFSGGNCADAYIGGQFTSVNGTTVKNIAEIDTTTGKVVTAFAHSASAPVNTLLGVAGHILAGGNYTSINGSTADPYMTSLNPVTGRDDGFVNLNISGNYQFPGVVSNSTKVFNQALSHGGTLDLVMGDFTSVGGQPRQQIFMLSVAGSTATVTDWSSPEFLANCFFTQPFYIRAAAWSPDDSTVYIGTTGYVSQGGTSGATPRSGLCDAAAAFPASQAPVSHTWINYTGCDSLYAAAADASAAYFGGHERFSMNPDDCDALGPGAYNAPGMEGLDPANGALYTDPTNSVGYYSRARGLGADDMLVTSGGLWIASDNYEGSQMCGGVQNLAGICFLPYA